MVKTYLLSFVVFFSVQSFAGRFHRPSLLGRTGYTYELNPSASLMTLEEFHRHLEDFLFRPDQSWEASHYGMRAFLSSLNGLALSQALEGLSADGHRRFAAIYRINDFKSKLRKLNDTIDEASSDFLLMDEMFPHNKFVDLMLQLRLTERVANSPSPQIRSLAPDFLAEANWRLVRLAREMESIMKGLPLSRDVIMIHVVQALLKTYPSLHDTLAHATLLLQEPQEQQRLACHLLKTSRASSYKGLCSGVAAALTPLCYACLMPTGAGFGFALAGAAGTILSATGVGLTTGVVIDHLTGGKTHRRQMQERVSIVAASCEVVFVSH